ncbi:phosphatase PAP2 family protein [Sphingomonas astaxanthinifaciens]|nr:phosphatase PAP2 family protein [Sphingomonas astaxanthinifaciens]
MLGRLLHRLKHGIPDAEIRSPFNPVTVPIYLIVFLFLLAGFGSLYATGFRLGPNLSLEIPLIAPFMILSAWASRRVGHCKIADCLETTALYGLFGIGALAATIAGSTSPAPLADSLLARADAMIGLDWPALVKAIPPWADQPLMVAYRSFLPQALFLLPLMVAVDRNSTAWRMLIALYLALAVAIIVYPLTPAIGPYLLNGMQPAEAYGPYPMAYGPAIQAIRNGERVVTNEMVTAYVSMPSFHASSALVYMWGAWRLPLIRWPILALNMTMIFAAMPAGGHYFVDLIGGVLVGAAAIWLSGPILQASARADGSNLLGHEEQPFKEPSER